MSGPPHERRLGSRALLELLVRNTVNVTRLNARRVSSPRAAGRADSVHDHERCAGGRRRQSDVAGPVHQHHVGGESLTTERVSQPLAPERVCGRPAASVLEAAASKRFPSGSLGYECVVP